MIKALILTPLIFVLLSLSSPKVWGLDGDKTSAGSATTSVNAAAEEGLRQAAKKRLYSGGRDEEPLRVQAQLPLATRKMAPATEAPGEPSAATPSDD